MELPRAFTLLTRERASDIKEEEGVNCSSSEPSLVIGGQVVSMSVLILSGFVTDINPGSWCKE